MFELNLDLKISYSNIFSVIKMLISGFLKRENYTHTHKIERLIPILPRNYSYL